MSSDDNNTAAATSFATALVAGGCAGTSVDVALFPIDTLKTRMQSPQGFVKAGGFRGVYNGLGAAAVGSAPGAALFFSSYETCKPIIRRWQQSLGGHGDSGMRNPAISHMVAASIGESAACLVRVPTEVIKAKMQTNAANASSLSKTFRLVLEEKASGPLGGFTGGLYRGYGITLMREIPFAMIQFPIYEFLKKYWTENLRGGVPVNPLQAAACGSFGGAIAAAATTPLDVVKTRLMLGADKDGKLYEGALDVIRRTAAENPDRKWVVFFSGIQPRVMWISIGGFVFFGAYEGFKTGLSPVLG
uniref:Mitochondrial carrier protein n=1 Tax=Pseudo-nitzschia delicatissima TaxID=44447 RepID=A0A7S0UF31_9STRA|mmetsp:Transcript_1676/g.3509  ORF Transcript_1676/g.3509 Transcript_1676/m.3509 type:complete len:303 (+) Transcript_1676:151-1059(+)